MKLTTTNAEDVKYARCMVHGPSGSGKTFSLGTLPVKGTTIVLRERSAGPLRNKGYKVIVLEDWDDVAVTYSAFKNPDACQDSELKAIVKETRVIAIDSLSEIGELCMTHIVEIARPRLCKERTNDKRDTPENTYAELPTIEDYNLFRAKMRAVVSAFCHLPYHIIMTALSAWSTDKGGSGITVKTPNLPGKSAFECVFYFDLVFYMLNTSSKPGEVERAFQTYADGQVLAKGDESLDLLELPNWTTVLTKYLKGGKNGKSE